MTLAPPLGRSFTRAFACSSLCTAVWGDEMDKFSSSKLWKTKWRILPREEKIPEEWLVDKYRGMWSQQTDSPKQFKEQWEAGAIRMVQFTLKLDVGRFGSYTTPLMWERGIFLFAHATSRGNGQERPANHDAQPGI